MEEENNISSKKIELLKQVFNSYIKENKLDISGTINDGDYKIEIYGTDLVDKKEHLIYIIQQGMTLKRANNITDNIGFDVFSIHKDGTKEDIYGAIFNKVTKFLFERLSYFYYKALQAKYL